MPGSIIVLFYYYFLFVSFCQTDCFNQRGVGDPSAPAEPQLWEQGAGGWDFLVHDAAGRLGSPGQGINDTVRGEFEFPHQ